MTGLNDPGMDRAHRHLEDPLAFNMAKMVFALLPTQHAIPREILLERMSALRPMFVANQTAQVGMSLRNQAEHVADFSRIPLRCMDMWRDGSEQTATVLQLRGEQQPIFALRQREEITDLVTRFVRTMVYDPKKRQGAAQTGMGMEIMRHSRHIVFLHPQLRRTVD